jgi:hypothetical protein
MLSFLRNRIKVKLRHKEPSRLEISTLQNFLGRGNVHPIALFDQSILDKLAKILVCLHYHTEFSIGDQPLLHIFFDVSPLWGKLNTRSVLENTLNAQNGP